MLFGNYSITVVTENGGKFMKDSLKSADPMVKKVDCKDGRLTVFFCTKAKDLVSPIHAVLAELTRLGYEANPRCPICGEKDCDCAIFLGREFRFAHRACVDTLDSDADAETKKSQKQGSVLLGILGAFLGMLVGTLPNLFTILSMEMEYSLLFALIPICAYFGYKLLGGKMKRPIPVIVSIVMSVIGVIMLLFEAVTIISMKEYDIPRKNSSTVSVCSWRNPMSGPTFCRTVSGNSSSPHWVCSLPGASSPPHPRRISRTPRQRQKCPWLCCPARRPRRKPRKKPRSFPEIPKITERSPRWHP